MLWLLHLCNSHEGPALVLNCGLGQDVVGHVEELERQIKKIGRKGNKGLLSVARDAIQQLLCLPYLVVEVNGSGGHNVNFAHNERGPRVHRDTVTHIIGPHAQNEH